MGDFIFHTLDTGLAYTKKKRKLALKNKKFVADSNPPQQITLNQKDVVAEGGAANH